MTDNAQQTMNRIIDFLMKTHDAQSEGSCKSSCSFVRFSYVYDRYKTPKTVWAVNFGGYCIGDLNRHCEVTADTLEELEKCVHEKIQTGLKELTYRCDGED